MVYRISGILRLAGFSMCLLCTVYMLYYAVSRQVVTALEASGERTLIAAGMVAVAEGEVVRAENGHTVVRYYHEWDGAEYQKVIAGENGDFSRNAVVPVIYTVGMGAGSCLAVGYYRKYMQMTGVGGTVLLLTGITLSFGRKGRERNGKKKDHSGQLEDEYDAQ